jgi:hypothetical protein
MGRRTKVPVATGKGPAVTIDADATVGAVLGQNLFNADGSLVTLNQLAAAIAAVLTPSTSGSLTTDRVAEGLLNLYFTVKRDLDAVAAAIAAGTHTGIAFVYDAGLGTFSFTVNAWTTATRVVNATTVSWVQNIIGAASVGLTTPATPAQGDQFSTIFAATRAGCTLIPQTGFTVMGSASAVPLTSPGSSRKGIVVWVLVGTDWIPLSVNTWA